jgi:hypothetical protein
LRDQQEASARAITCGKSGITKHQISDTGSSAVAATVDA